METLLTVICRLRQKFGEAVGSVHGVSMWYAKDLFHSGLIEKKLHVVTGVINKTYKGSKFYSVW